MEVAGALGCLARDGTRCVASVGRKIDHSGGTGGKGTDSPKVYTAPDGTTVTSSVDVYSSGASYYMSYLFDGSILTSASTFDNCANGISTCPSRFCR